MTKISTNGRGIKTLMLLAVFALFITGCADAGKDQSVVSSTTVTLDASASKVDFNGEIKKYRWKQTEGTKVKLSDKKTIHPTFISPTVTEETILTFRLTTVEKGGYYSPWRTRDEVNIIISPSSSNNTPPSAIAEVNVTSIKYGDSVTFNANNSTDSDGQIVSYEWKDENNLLLSSEVQFIHTFDTSGTHTLTLTVTDDDSLSTTDSVTVTVEALQKPIAIINTDTDTIFVGESITFDANASSDADGEIVSYQWLAESNTTLSNEKSFTHIFTTSGEYNITLVVTDDDEEEGRAVIDIVVEAQLVSLLLEATTPTIDVNTTTSLTATANYNDNTSQYASSSVEWIVTDTSIVSVDANGTLTALKSGTTTVKVKIGDIISNIVSIEVTTPTLLQSISVSPNPIELRVGQSIQVSVLGLYSDGTTQVVEDVDYAVNDTNIASVNGTGSLDAIAEGVTTLRANAGGVLSPLVSVSVRAELNTTNFNFTNFGGTYTNQIPIDATLNQYDEKRFCMIAGQILSEDGSPLSGVEVSIHKHDEYGSTLTDSNGTYVIPAEGGLQLTMRYTKEGYTTIDRKVFAPVQDWVRAPNVTMLEIDTKVTQIDLNNITPQIHVSTPVTDDRGERSTTLVFDGVTNATVTAPDGSTRELTNLSVRATEFKTPESMPSDLPKESAYTYCSDLQVDGVNDDEEISFDAPVVMYVDNFLSFNVGEIVPVGYYDRNQGKWIGSDNGAVIALLDTNGDGIVDALDSTGDGNPNDLDGDGSFSDEVAGIQDNPSYVAGKSYWRAEMMHFTPWDKNWPYGPPADAEEPDQDDPKTDEDSKNDCQRSVSSYVTSKSRVFHEDIPVAGTDITLHYSSSRVEGYNHTIEASVDTSSLPASVQGATVTLSVAGRSFTKTPDLTELGNLQFIWDGKDILGNMASGTVTATIKVSYIYQVVYLTSTTSFVKAWARIGGSSTGVIGRNTIEIVNSRDVKINVNVSQDINSYIANGWTLSNHDRASGNTIAKGDGSVEKSNNIRYGIISTVAGNGNYGFGGDGGLATEASLNFPQGATIDNAGNLYIADSNNNRIRKIDSSGIITTIAGNSFGYRGDGGLATEASLNFPQGATIDNAGNLYIADSGNSRIRKIDSSGIITTIAGNGNYGFGGDGGLATVASLNVPKIVTIDNTGNLYIADSYNNRIRKIDALGIITTIAGNGNRGYGGDGGLATEASLNSPQGAIIDNAGNLYIADSSNNRIRKIDASGIITTIAGNGNRGYGGDGGLATEASLNSPQGATIDNAGNLYIADSNNNRIRKIDASGIITTIAGNGNRGYGGDGGSSIEASLNSPQGVTIDNAGNLYIADSSNDRIRKVSASLLFQLYDLSLNYSMYLNPNNAADIFDIIGKHIKTIDLNTDSSLKEFTYDENDHLISITNQFGEVTTITRDSQGNPTQITAPNGQITTLTVDENNNLIQVSYENNSKYELTYFDGSLMDIMTDPNGNIIQHVWNDIGRIVEEVDGEGGSYRFLRNVTGNETFYSTILPEGEISSSKDVVLANGDTHSTMTLPTGKTVTATFSKDEKSTSSLRDGVTTNYTYTADTLTQQKILASQETTQPSGLKNITTHSTTYDGNETHTNSKTQTITNNTKTTTLVTDYNNGTSTLITPTGRVATSTYDVDTLLTSSIQSGTLTPTTYAYDDKGRTTKEATGTRETTYTYNAKGNIATVTDPRGKVTTLSYDIMDRVTTVTHPNGTTEEYSYDANFNMIKRVVPTPTDHTFTYDGVDSRTSYTSPLNKATTYTYDKNRRVTAITKPSGATISNTYDKGRIVSTTTPESTTSYSYLFADKVGSISKGSESFTYGYDGTLLTSMVQVGVLSHITNYAYNNDFQVISSSYADQTENYTYDNDGLLITSGAYTITRDPQNAYTTQVTDGTLTQNRSYNAYGEVTQVDDNTFTYELSQRDNAGAIVQKREILNGATTIYDYTFDDMGRLTQVEKDSSVVEEYTYDNNGNRASATVNGVSTSASYTLDDQLEVYGDNSYRYDDDGYLTEKVTPDGTTAYTYGTLGELREVVTPTKTIEYLHNANNQRVAKKVNGTIVEKYLWANLTTLLAIYNGSDNLVQRFEYADQRMPISMSSGGTKYYLHYDQVGSLRAVSDSSGTIVKEIVYDTHGTILSDTNEAFKVPFRFAGGLYDADTKLTRFGYRDYDAYTGKWTAKDPIGFDGGDSNLYGYVLGDPVNFVDPMGLDNSSASALDIAGAIITSPFKGYTVLTEASKNAAGLKKGADAIKKRNEQNKKFDNCCKEKDKMTCYMESYGN